MSKILGLNVSLYISSLAQKAKSIQIHPPYTWLPSPGVLQRLYYLISALDKTFQLYHKLNPYPIKHLLGDHLSSYKIWRRCPNKSIRGK